MSLLPEHGGYVSTVVGTVINHMLHQIGYPDNVFSIFRMFDFYLSVQILLP